MFTEESIRPISTPQIGSNITFVTLSMSPTVNDDIWLITTVK